MLHSKNFFQFSRKNKFEMRNWNISHLTSWNEISKWDYFFSLRNWEIEMRIFFLSSEVRFWNENIFSHLRSEILKWEYFFSFPKWDFEVRIFFLTWEVRILKNILTSRFPKWDFLNLISLRDHLPIPATYASHLRTIWFHFW